MSKVAQAVLEVLDRAQTEGPRLTLVGQLDRKLYTETNKVLEAAGGRWDRRAKAHVFDGDAADAMEAIILTGEFSRTKQEFGQFFTPGDLARTVTALALIEPDMLVLEPSAGHGALALEARNQHALVKCVEIDRKNCEVLAGLVAPEGVIEVRQGDFLAIEPEPAFDRVLMNPPFAKQADIDHVLHATRFLKPGGRLVSIMSSSVTFRDNAKTQAFRDLVDAHDGVITPLPDNSFKASGTAVNTCVVSFNA